MLVIAYLISAAAEFLRIRAAGRVASHAVRWLVPLMMACAYVVAGASHVAHAPELTRPSVSPIEITINITVVNTGHTKSLRSKKKNFGKSHRQMRQNKRRPR